MSNENKNGIPMPSLNSPAAVVVLADGEYPCRGLAAELLSAAESVICCDGAAQKYVGEGGVPVAIAGDMDSLSPELRERFAEILYPDSDQETNDLTKAVTLASKMGYERVVILGATGKREDHSIGNISLLKDYVNMFACGVQMVTSYGVFDAVSCDSRFEAFAGQQVSLLVPDPATSLTTVDLKYPLHRAHLSGWWMGTLNESLGDSFGICCDGPVIVFRLFRE